MSLDVEGILAWAADRLGGQAAIDDVHSLHAPAAVDGPGGSFVSDIHSAADGRVRFEQRSGEQMLLLAGIGRDQAWQQREQVAQLSDAAVTFLRGHELHMLLLQPRSRLAQPQLESPTDFGGRQANVICWRDKLDAPLRVYYDSGNGRPLGMQIVSHRAADELPVIVELSDWQPCGRLLLFHQAQMRQGEELFAYRYRPIALNCAVDAVFEPHLDPDLVQLLQLHEQQRQAHLARDSKLLVSSFADPLIDISRGAISSATSSASEERFAAYFEQVAFEEWENIAPPQFTLSDDRTLATVAVRKRVRLRPVARPQAAVLESLFAWLEVWQKQAQGWRLTTICSSAQAAPR